MIPTLGKDMTRLNRAIESIRTHSQSGRPRIVVINNSGKSPLAGLSEVDEVLEPGMNLGYVGALEFARRTLDCDFLWSIQDDMALQNDVLAQLLSVMQENPDLAVASPILVREGMVPARSRAGVFSNDARTRWENYPFVDTRVAELETDRDFCFVSGSGALFRREALDQIGGFNVDLFPLMHVDVDVCLRLLDAQWQLSLVSAAHIEHEIQGSTPGIVGQALHRLHTPQLEEALEGATFETSPVNTALDHDLVFRIARKSSTLFLDVAAEANRRIEQLHEYIATIQQESESRRRELEIVYSSRSWRITAPLRKLVSLVQGRNHDGTI